MTADTLDPAVKADHIQLLQAVQNDSKNQTLLSQLASHIADDSPELAAALSEVFTAPPPPPPPPLSSSHQPPNKNNNNKKTHPPPKRTKTHTKPLSLSLSTFSLTSIAKAIKSALSRPKPSKPQWQNWIGNQIAHPQSIQHPKSLQDLVSAVRTARAQGIAVRAVGSGHSFSDVAVTDGGLLVDPHAMNAVLPSPDPTQLRSGVDASVLFAVESGITLKDLNAALDARGLALVQMGAYDGQTLAGAISTGTHGTGLGLGPMASMVRAVTLVDSEGVVYRVEPGGAAALTDAEKFANSQSGRARGSGRDSGRGSGRGSGRDSAASAVVVLKQDDDWFQTVTVGMGCVGLIYSYVLEVRPAYLLEEDRTATTWEDLKKQLAVTGGGAGGEEEGNRNFADVIRNNRHFEIDVNPYAFNDVHMAIVTLKNESPGPAVRDGEGRGFWNWLGSKLAGWDWAQSKLATLLNAIPMLSPVLINKAMNTLVNLDYIDKSFRVMNVGIGDVEAMALELSIPEDGWIETVDRLLAVFAEEASTRDMFLAGPVALRFVAPAEAYLAPQYGRHSIMAELTMLYGVESGKELVKTVKRRMCTPGSGIRVHWGLDLDTVTAEEARDMYPLFGKWEAVYRQLNANGLFNSRFTERLGLSVKK